MNMEINNILNTTETLENKDNSLMKLNSSFISILKPQCIRTNKSNFICFMKIAFSFIIFLLFHFSYNYSKSEFILKESILQEKSMLRNKRTLTEHNRKKRQISPKNGTHQIVMTDIRNFQDEVNREKDNLTSNAHLEWMVLLIESKNKSRSEYNLWSNKFNIEVLNFISDLYTQFAQKKILNQNSLDNKKREWEKIKKKNEDEWKKISENVTKENKGCEKEKKDLNDSTINIKTNFSSINSTQIVPKENFSTTSLYTPTNKTFQVKSNVNVTLAITSPICVIIFGIVLFVILFKFLPIRSWLGNRRLKRKKIQKNVEDMQAK